jgi:hypothetical protein
MIYQGTAYQYNQRSEIVLPTRRGTTYHQPQNHKPFVVYSGLDHDLEFFVTNSDRKPVSLQNKTFTAKIIDRSEKSIRVTKTLVPVSYDTGNLVMKLTQSDTSSLESGLYDLTITYTDSEGRILGLYSDQNSRLTYVVEVKPGTSVEIRPSEEATQFTDNGNGEFYTGRFPGTAQSYNQDGTNTCAVYVTNYTGKFYAQGTLETAPTEHDWFTIQLDPETAEDEWQFTNSSGVVPFTWDGMFVWVRFYHDPDPTNTGTLDKVLYRN